MIDHGHRMQMARTIVLCLFLRVVVQTVGQVWCFWINYSWEGPLLSLRYVQ